MCRLDASGVFNAGRRRTFPACRLVAARAAKSSSPGDSLQPVNFAGRSVVVTADNSSPPPQVVYVVIIAGAAGRPGRRRSERIDGTTGGGRQSVVSSIAAGRCIGERRRPNELDARRFARSGANTPRLDALRSRLRRCSNSSSAPSRRLRAIGVDTNSPVRLEEGPFGDVVCDGSHPEHRAIDEIFFDDPSLAATFRELNACLTALRASRQDPTASASDDSRLCLRRWAMTSTSTSERRPVSPHSWRNSPDSLMDSGCSARRNSSDSLCGKTKGHL